MWNSRSCSTQSTRREINEKKLVQTTPFRSILSLLVVTSTREHPLVNPADEEKALSRFQALMKSEHWLATYITDLLSAHDLSGSVDFSAAEQLLSAEREQFEKDLAVARRMVRIYGKQLVNDNIPQLVHSD